MQTLEHLAHSTFTPIFYWGPEPWINKLRHEKGFAWTHLCCCCCCCCCYIVIWKISFHNKLIAHRELGWVWHWFLNHLPQLTPFVKRDTIQVNKWKEKFGRLGKDKRNGDNCPHLRWGGSEAAPWLVQPGSITKRKSTQAKFIVAASQSNSGMWWHRVTLVLSKLWIGGCCRTPGHKQAQIQNTSNLFLINWNKTISPTLIFCIFQSIQSN